MANESSVYSSAAGYIYTVVGSVNNIGSIPVNCWALQLIVCGKRSLIQSELLTLNLITMETMCSVGFLLSLIRIFCRLSSLRSLQSFYHALAVVGRALFQCHVCVDRYLAVVHPAIFTRYKQIRYRGACLAGVWLVVAWAAVSYSVIPSNATTYSICSFALLVPAFFTELFCSLSILRILRRPSPGHKKVQEKKEGNQQKKRAIKIICIMLLMLVFNMVPFIAVPLLLKVTQVDLLPVAFTLATVGSSAQAFLFLSRSGALPCKGKL